MKIKNFAFGSIFALSVISANANLVSNGGFEAGTTNWTTTGLTCSAAGTSVAVTACFGIDSDPGAHSGINAMYLGTANTNGGLSQDIGTMAGATYLVDFWLANGRYNGNSAPNGLLIEFDDQTLLSLTNAPAQPYTHYSFLISAIDSTSTLKFTGRQDPSFWVLDDVSVTTVPEPSSLALVGLVLAGMGAATKRRRAARGLMGD